MFVFIFTFLFTLGVCTHYVYLLITMYTCTKNLHLCSYVYLLITMYWFDMYQKFASSLVCLA